MGEVVAKVVGVTVGVSAAAIVEVGEGVEV